MDSDPEFDLGVELEVFSVKIDWCILVLSLIDSIDSWNLDVNIDKMFFSVYNKIDNILEYISDVDIQEKIVIRYYDLVLKKILKDYENKVYEYLNEYNDIDKYVYLMDSIKRYLESKNIVLEDSISSYSLEDIIKKVYNGKSSKKEKSLESIEDSTKKDIVMVDDKKTSVVKVNNNSFFDNVRNFWMNKFYYIKSLSELGDVDINNEVDMGVLILNDIFNIDRDFIKNCPELRRNNKVSRKDRLRSRRRAPANYLIVCEGKKTETNYFNGLKKKINEKYGNKVDVLIPNIEVKGTGRNTVDLVKYVQKYVNYSSKVYGWV